MALKIYYIRHGETEWSLEGKHTGRTDIPLTAQGERQARALKPWLRSVAFDRVLRSPRQRAGLTCELTGLGEAAEIEQDLAEWDYGEYEGLRSPEIRAGRAGWNLFDDGCPGGETPAEIGARADRLISRLVAQGGTVALFAHGGFGSVLAARWIGLPTAQGQHFYLDPACVSVLSYRPGYDGVRDISLWNAAPRIWDGGA